MEICQRKVYYTDPETGYLQTTVCGSELVGGICPTPGTHAWDDFWEVERKRL